MPLTQSANETNTNQVFDKNEMLNDNRFRVCRHVLTAKSEDLNSSCITYETSHKSLRQHMSCTSVQSLQAVCLSVVIFHLSISPFLTSISPVVLWHLLSSLHLSLWQRHETLGVGKWLLVQEKWPPPQLLISSISTFPHLICEMWTCLKPPRLLSLYSVELNSPSA